ncbi:MAG: hypothetical protein LBE27_00655 [Deltaproteobacteria bacterium]|nr:hypothetical protein [Deltaproteobacteria bacterium]
MSSTDLSVDKVQSIGESFIIHKILQRRGVKDILLKIFEKEIFAETTIAIATYMASQGNIIDSIESWGEEHFMDSMPLSLEKAAERFTLIHSVHMKNFFAEWRARNQTDAHLIYDVTSYSRCAIEIDSAQSHIDYNGEKFPVTRVLCYLSQRNGIPLFYVTSKGPIWAEWQVIEKVRYNEELGIREFTYVMDRGRPTKMDLDLFHSHELQYVMGLDKHHRTTREAINVVRDDIVSDHNQIYDGVYSKTISSRFYGFKSKMHVYYVAEDAEQQKRDILFLFESIGEKLKWDSHIAEDEVRKLSPFYDITITKDKTVSFSVNNEKIRDVMMNCGYFCILSNLPKSGREILDIYSRKDILDKSFSEIKNFIDIKKFPYGDKTITGKLFCAFIALIARSEMMRTFNNVRIFTEIGHWSNQDILHELEKIKVVTLSNGTRLLNTLTKEQLEILKEFELNEQDLRAYAYRRDSNFY